VRLKPRECVVARRHQRHLQAKIDLRDVLDMRRKGGFRAAARLMLRRARNAPYIVRQKVADGMTRRAAKLKAATRRLHPRGIVVRPATWAAKPQ
jgi:hypothetical protein